MWHVDSVVSALRLQSTGSVVRGHWLICSAVGSSQTRNRTHVPCITRWILNPWTPREALFFPLGDDNALLQVPSSLGMGRGVQPALSTVPTATPWSPEREGLLCTHIRPPPSSPHLSASSDADHSQWTSPVGAERDRRTGLPSGLFSRQHLARVRGQRYSGFLALRLKQVEWHFLPASPAVLTLTV